MVARSRFGGQSTKCDSDGRKTNPYRPATSHKQEVHAGTPLHERGHRRVPDLGGAPESEPAGGPINQALGPSIRSTQGGQRKDSNYHGSAAIKFRLGSTPHIQNRQLANRGGVPVTEPKSDLGSCGGSIELLLLPRPAYKRGEKDQDQDGDGRLSMDSPASRSTLLPLLDGPTSPSCGEDVAPPGSSPDLV